MMSFKVRSRYRTLVVINIILLLLAIYTRFKFLEVDLPFINYVITIGMSNLVLISDLKKAIDKYDSEEDC